MKRGSARGRKTTVAPAALAAVGLALLVLFAFLPALSAKLLRWDDAALLSANPLLNPPTIASLWKIWSGPVAGLYTPLAYTLWAGAAALAEPARNPALYHALNLVLHAGATFAAFLLIRSLVPGVLAAFAGAAVFAVHPLQVEPVAWVAGMNNVLAGGLAIAAAWLYVLHARADDRRRRTTLLIATCATGALAMLAKPTAVVAPLLMLWIDLAALRRGWRRAVAATLPAFAIAVVLAIVARTIQPAEEIDRPPLAFRPVVALDALAFYAGKLIWPADLTIDYGRTPQWLSASAARYYTWIVPAAVLLAAVLLARRWRWLLVGAGWFALAMLPTLGLLAFDFQRYSTVADRYAYLSIVGAGVIVAAAVAARPRVSAPVAAIGILALAAGTFMQSLHWEDDLSLMSRAIAVNPDSLAGNRTIAAILVDAGRADDALRFATRAVERHPRSADAWANLAAARMARGDFPAAVAAYERGLSLRPNDPTLLSSHSAALAQSGDLDRALLQAERAVQADPDFAPARLNLGTVYAQMNRIDDAVAELRAAHRLQPRDPRACTNLAAMLLAQGKALEAESLLQEALRSNPDFAPARRLLAEMRSGRRQ